MTMDILRTIEADSTQVNADDLTGSPRTVTITGVSKGTAEQPVNIELAEFPGKAYRPCKTMRRVLVSAWGSDASTYVGRRLTLFNDESVKWGGQSVGGVRIKAMSHIEKPLKLAVTVTRGKRAPYVVEPLRDEPAHPPLPADLADKIAASGDVEWLRKTRAYLDKYRASEPDRVVALKGAIDTRTEQLAAPAPQDVPHDGMDEFAQEAGE